MELQKYDLDSKIKDLEFDILYKEKDYYPKEFCKHTQRNQSWKLASLTPQNLTIALDRLSNVTYLILNNLHHGSELTISIAEYQTGPFIDMYKKKYFTRSETKRISLGNLPCQYVKIVCSKGVHLDLNNIRIVGFYPEDVEEIFGGDTFKLLVTNPQRLLYN